MSKTVYTNPIEYNDVWDEINCPYKSWHLEALEEVERIYGIQLKGSWEYIASMSGAIFSFIPKHNNARFRVTRSQMSELLKIECFGWIEASPNKLVVRFNYRKGSKYEN